MSFTIKHGLFKSSITDYHAILGVSLDADPKTIRLKYLSTAQKLHPDTCKANGEEKKLASQILSKLVNPAYKELSNKSQFAEHQLVLTQIGKRYAQKIDRMTIASEPARKLLQADKNIDKLYQELLTELTTNQYQNINKALTKIAVISELNFVYLVAKHKQGINREERIIQQKLSQPPKGAKPPKKAQSKPKKTRKPQNTPPQPPQEDTEIPTPQSRATSYIRRAKEYMAKGDINDAISELRDALKIDPNNSTAHALMGRAYLHQNQLTMARVHINKADSVEPKDPEVIQSKEQLEKLTKKQQKKATKPPSKSSEPKKSGDSGFFSGFFGTKKK